MEELILLTLSILLMFSNVSGAPNITSTPDTLTEQVGAYVMLPCRVTDLGNSKVNWKLVDHNLHISTGTKILVDIADNHYSIAQQQDSPSGASGFSLIIGNLKLTDQGHYSCEVDSTGQKIVYYLKIKDAVVPPTQGPISQNFNFSDCCVEQNVKSDCKVLCTPLQIPVNFDPVSTCPLEIGKIMTCAADGMNHAACCKRRNVPDKCLDFCLGQIPANLNDDHLSCLQYISSFMTCIEEGRELLPGPVGSVTALAAETSASVLWKNSAKNGNLVTGYRIHYRKDIDKNYRSTDILSKESVIWQENSYLYSLNSLESDSQYRFYVTAISQHGSSQPSEIVAFRTVSSTAVANKNETLHECCNRRVFKDVCKKGLCQSDGFSNLDPQLIMGECHDAFNEVLKCSVGERDHSACCKRVGIPDHCLPFCGSGIDHGISWNTTQCIYMFPLIQGCIEEGSKTIPATPKAVELVKVEYNKATITWEASPMATSYVISYKEDYPDKPQKFLTISGGTFVELMNLQALTPYRVQILAKNENGSSIPSPFVIFITEGVPQVTPATTTPEPSPNLNYDLEECCKKNNFPTKCMPMCNYQNIITMNQAAVSLFLDATCQTAFLTVLKCGSDGRDHKPCCKSKSVPDMCLPLCSYTGDDSELDPQMDDLTCAFQSPVIAECFQEGILKFPLAPEGLGLQGVFSHIALLSWRKPSRGPTIDSFNVMYTSNEKTKQISTQKTFATLNNLQPETWYDVRVVSVNNNGSSANSDAVRFLTPPYFGDKNCSYNKNENMEPYYKNPVSIISSNTDKMEECQKECDEASPAFQACVGFTYQGTGGACSLYNRKYEMSLKTKQGTDYYDKSCTGPGVNITATDAVTWQNRTHCCENSGIDQGCVQFCITGNPASAHKCIFDFNKAIACLADGRNHESCCKINGVPDVCLPYCRGQVVKPSATAALCISYSSVYVTCTALGSSVLPSRPLNLEVSVKGSVFLTLKWTAPQMNCNKQLPCSYDILYSRVGSSDPPTQVSTGDLTYNITGLMVNTAYSVRVYARNTNGSSLPTPEIVVTTYAKEYLDISVKQTMPNVVDVGYYIALICDAYGSRNMKSVTWTYNMKIVSRDNNHAILTMEDNGGLYTCTATMEGGMTRSKSLYLAIRHKPEISTLHANSVEANKGFTGLLSCEFKGFPTTVEWSKDNTPIDTKYFRYNKYEVQRTKVVTAFLQVNNVVDSDYGSYVCKGSNKFGSVPATLVFKAPGAPTTTTLKPPSTKNYTECCGGYGVTGICLSLCKLGVDFSKVFGNSTYDACVLHMEAYAKCGTDGKDHTKCCTESGVSNFCIGFCSANIPNMNNPLVLECIDQTKTILKCLEENNERIPSPPQNVVAVWKGREIDLSWKPPKEINGLNHYKVYWTVALPANTTLQKPQHHTVSKDILQYVVNNVVIGTYKFWVVAKNEVGESQKALSNQVQVTGWKPLQVQNVVATLKGSNSISLSWNQTSGTGITYTVQYKPVDGGSSLTKSTSLTSYTLQGLNYDSTYTITVFATNDVGQGNPSEAVTVKTKPGWKPLQVQNVVATLKGSNSISLSWNQTSGTGITYTVQYKPVDGGSSLTKSTSLTSYTLQGLNYDSTYTITVFATNDVGQGNPSEAVTVKTKPASKSVKPQAQTSNKSLVVGVSISVVVIALIALAAGVFLYLRHKRNKPFGMGEVAFENPQYGSPGENVQISGLPAERGDEASTGSFGYAPLQDDGVDSHLYDNPATLKAEQVGVSFK